MTTEHHNDALMHLGFPCEAHAKVDEVPGIQICSAKISNYSEGLVDIFFESVRRFFSWFILVYAPRLLRKLNSKQYDEIELLEKGACYKGRHTIEVCYSFV